MHPEQHTVASHTTEQHAHDAGQQHHKGHEHHHGTAASTPGRTSWATAAQATLHCLTGCAIGEVLGMVIGTALGLHNAATVVLSIALAFLFGYGLTMRGVLHAGVGVRAALTVALAADTVSIAVMELLDNAFVLAVPGAMNAGLTLHVETLYGENSHHIAESCFKGLARALRAAVAIDPSAAGEVPSTKGQLGG